MDQFWIHFVQTGGIIYNILLSSLSDGVLFALVPQSTGELLVRSSEV